MIIRMVKAIKTRMFLGKLLEGKPQDKKSEDDVNNELISIETLAGYGKKLKDMFAEGCVLTGIDGTVYTSLDSMIGTEPKAIDLSRLSPSDKLS